MSKTNWKINQSSIVNGCRYTLRIDTDHLSNLQLLELLAHSNDFADWYTEQLVAAQFQAAYWELPPIGKSALQKPAEFVLLDAPELNNRLQNKDAFAEHFSSAGSIASFSSLGKDARLIAPCPTEATTRYGHLLDFLRTAPTAQIRDFWHVIGQEMLATIATRRVWLNTSGLGIQWLHVRLDSQPKYYQHQPYKLSSAGA